MQMIYSAAAIASGTKSKEAQRVADGNWARRDLKKVIEGGNADESDSDDGLSLRAATDGDPLVML